MCTSITLSNSNWLCQPHAIFLGTENSQARSTISACPFSQQLAEREKAFFVRNNGLLKNTQLLLCWSFTHSRRLSQPSAIKSLYCQGQRWFFTRYHGSWQHLQPWYHRRYLISRVPCILWIVNFIGFTRIWIRKYCTKWEFMNKCTLKPLIISSSQFKDAVKPVLYNKVVFY